MPAACINALTLPFKVGRTEEARLGSKPRSAWTPRPTRSSGRGAGPQTIAERVDDLPSVSREVVDETATGPANAGRGQAASHLSMAATAQFEQQASLPPLHA
jgi:hypothetical protein